jgi:peptidoglycan/xylan/chitin deacetylase (PgdA/CDA1 family)
MYHRVSTARLDPFGICVKPEHFADQVAHLRKRFAVLSIDELASGLKSGRPPKRAIALTLDDGYADVLSHAAPVLEAYEVPATAFVTFASLGSESRFWWDELARVLFTESCQLDSLRLTIRGATFRWQMQGPGARSEMETYFDIHGLLRPLTEAERREALFALSSQYGTPVSGSTNDRPLTEAELRTLAGSSRIRVGAHSMTHPMLSAQPEEIQRWEIRESKVRLEALLGESVDSFAYPHGDLGASTARLVQECGFRLAFTATPGLVRRHADSYRLPRFLAPDCDGAALCERLDAWFAGALP